VQVRGELAGGARGVGADQTLRAGRVRRGCPGRRAAAVIPPSEGACADDRTRSPSEAT
jgi:hypothetical protein